MAVLTRLFGDKPRVRLLEALIELSPHEFTMPELAEESGLDKNVYRDAGPLEEGGLIVRVGHGTPARYRVRVDSTRFRLIDLIALLCDRIEVEGHEQAKARALLDAWWSQLPEAETVEATTASSVNTLGYGDVAEADHGFTESEADEGLVDVSV